MEKREAFLRVLRREDAHSVHRMYPPDIELTPPKYDEFVSFHTGKSVEEYFGLFHRSVRVAYERAYSGDGHQLFADKKMPAAYEVDVFGIGRSRGSEACHHMVHFHSPLQGSCSNEDILNYPLPDIPVDEPQRLQREIADIHRQGLGVKAWLEQTIWERAWLIRSMEDLMVDMMLEDRKADLLLERISEHSIRSAKILASCGADVIALGDDVGMQKTPLMNPVLWRRFIKPRLVRVIQAAKSVNPDVIIRYHSCGFVVPFIEDLIDAGVEVLNPLQPESMDVAAIYRQYHDRLAFWGSIGTQSTMPFGTPEDVRAAVMDRVRISADSGGFLIAPTHVIEPEVPWENLYTYAETMDELNSGK